MKRVLITALVLCLALLPACGKKMVYNAAADLPEGTQALLLKEAGKSNGQLYMIAQTDGRSFTFRLSSENFSASCWEPKVVGQQNRMDYSAEGFLAWYESAKTLDMAETEFSYAFEGDEITSLVELRDRKGPTGNEPVTYDALPEGVSYTEDYTLEGDPGDNLSAPEAAVKLFNAVIRYYDYRPRDAVAITLMGLEFVNDAECYLYTVQTSDGTTKHAVDYSSGVVYVNLDGEYLPIADGDRGDIAPANMDAGGAQAILQDAIHDLTQEKAANGPIALVARGEDTVNGQRAWLFALGADTPEKFTAEYHFAVTEDREPRFNAASSNCYYLSLLHKKRMAKL